MDRVLNSIFEVPRHRFIPSKFISQSYSDETLPIGYNRSVYQPYIVALMAEAAEISPDDRILEIGTGCGYTTAVLSRLARDVISIEDIEELFEETVSRLQELGLQNIAVINSNCTEGCPQHAPYNAIIVNPPAEFVPPGIFHQLARGGRLVVPMLREGGIETLSRFTRLEDGSILEETILEQRNPFYVDLGEDNDD